MTLKDSFNFMVSTLSGYYAKTHNDELGGMLGGFDTSIGGRPFDPAAWDDWISAVRKISKKDNLSEEEIKKAILFLLKEYNEHHGFDLKEVIEYFSIEDNWNE
jgi:hypothetical protein